MKTVNDNFDIRSVQSSQLWQDSLRGSILSNTMESVFIQDQEISQMIRQLILDEKKKNNTSKTQNYYQPQYLKRCHSLSYVQAKKRSFELPIHLKNYIYTERKCPNLSKNQLIDSIYGAFFGFVIGDAIGSNVAFKNPNQNQINAALLMTQGGTYNIGSGQGTDITQLFLSCCYGLIDGKNVYNKQLMARRYIKWAESKPFNVSAIFLLSMTQLRNKKKNLLKNNEKLSDILCKSSQKNKMHESNIGLIRILPLCVWGINLSQKQFCQLIKDQLSMICPNELVIQSGIVYGMMIRLIFKNKDHQYAFYQISKWVYNNGSQKLKGLWRHVELDLDIQSRGNTGKLKTCFTYAFIQTNKRQINFMQSLLRTLLRGGDTDANSAIVLALVGSIVGYNNIPSYFKNKIVNFRMKTSPRQRSEQYSPFNIIQIVQKLLKHRPYNYSSI